MAYNNRLRNLPLELFFNITNQLTIFDLVNMEKSDLFELNEQGISDVIQAAFERPRHIRIHIAGMYEEEELKTVTKLILRCGTGLRSFKIKWGHAGSFLMHAENYDSELGLKLAASCPNIERFYKDDHLGYRSRYPFRDYIRNVEVCKLAEINATPLTLDDLRIVFTPSLKSIIFEFLDESIKSMEELSVSRPNFGTNIEQLRISPDSGFDSDIFRKLNTFFPNLKTFKVQTTRIKCVYNREQIYRPDFVYQIQLITKYHLDDLPYINKEHGEKLDLSAIVKYRPNTFHFYADVIDQLTNLLSLGLSGEDTMSQFSDCLSDTTFKSLKELNFTHLKLNAETLPKFEKILLTGRFVIRSIFQTYSYNVHSTLIPLLNRFCRNGKDVYIGLVPAETETVMLSAVEMELLKDVDIAYELKCELKGESDTPIMLLLKGIFC